MDDNYLKFVQKLIKDVNVYNLKYKIFEGHNVNSTVCFYGKDETYLEVKIENETITHIYLEKGRGFDYIDLDERENPSIDDVKLFLKRLV